MDPSDGGPVERFVGEVSEPKYLLEALEDVGQGIWMKIWRVFIKELDKKGQIDWAECFMVGSFVSAKKGAQKLGKPSVAGAPSSWWWQMARVFLWKYPLPLPVHMR